MALPDDLTALPNQVFLVDTGYVRPQFDAAYLLVSEGRAALIETGVNASVPRLLHALEVAGLAPDAVDAVIVTHVHLDHAGGAGALIARLPNARLVVHPRGARHLVDPSKLMAGTIAVYGEARTQALYGALVPVLADRVVEASDGLELTVGRRTLVCLDTPGHARHHLCVVDERGQGIFTGDTLGLRYPELSSAEAPVLLPTTTPVQFEPEALLASIERLAALKLPYLYLTHYGRVACTTAAIDGLKRGVEALTRAALVLREAPSRHEALVAAALEILVEAVGDTPKARALLAADAELNAQGLGVYLDREAR